MDLKKISFQCMGFSRRSRRSRRGGFWNANRDDSENTKRRKSRRRKYIKRGIAALGAAGLAYGAYKMHPHAATAYGTAKTRAGVLATDAKKAAHDFGTNVNNRTQEYLNRFSKKALPEKAESENTRKANADMARREAAMEAARLKRERDLEQADRMSKMNIL